VSHEYRTASVADIPDLMSIRNAVRENALVSAVIAHDDYVQAMTVDGRAWLCEVDEETVGFVNPRDNQGDIWALFVRESHEGQGIGSALMDIAERWMFERPLTEIRLSTAAGTRAERLYRHRGWRAMGLTDTGEVSLRLLRSEWQAPHMLPNGKLLQLD
jgi:GNAT superfamily N-acetyltransferase